MQGHKSFTIDGETYQIDTREWPCFHFRRYSLYSTNCERWIYVPNRQRRVLNPDDAAKYAGELPRFVEEDEAIDMLHRGGAYNAERFEDLPLDVRREVLERAGRYLE